MRSIALAAALLLATVVGSAARAAETAITPQTLIDRAEIEDLLTRYYYNLGHGSTDSFARFYTDDAELFLGPKHYKGKAGIENAYASARKELPPTMPFSFNVSLSNPLIIVKGDHATAEMIFTEIVIDTRGATPHLRAQGREYDDLVKLGGEWRFAKRQILPGTQAPPGWPG